MDENTIYVNTDCIVSVKERDDLEIGEEVGQFKLERDGEDFACNGDVHQWNLEKPAYPGIPKEWFLKFPEWDLLKDPPPPNQNIYQFNQTTFQLEKRSVEHETAKKLIWA